MIFNHHLLLKELLHRTISIDYNGKNFGSNFYEADLLELNKVLSKAETKYPLIWLETGYKENHRVYGGEVKITNCNFVFITKGDATDYFDKRYKTTFDSILYRVLAKFEEKIKVTKGIRFDTEYHDVISLPFNDVTELSARNRTVNGVNQRATESTPLIDIWDALILTTDLSINPQCFSQFIINK